MAHPVRALDPFTVRTVRKQEHKGVHDPLGP